MRAVRRKKEIVFLGWALVSTVLLLAAARAEDESAVYVSPAVPANAQKQPTSQEILQRAKNKLPQDQYDAFERAIHRLERDNSAAEVVIDGSNIPSVINFD